MAAPEATRWTARRVVSDSFLLAERLASRKQGTGRRREVLSVGDFPQDAARCLWSQGTSAKDIAARTTASLREPPAMDEATADDRGGRQPRTRRPAVDEASTGGVHRGRGRADCAVAVIVCRGRGPRGGRPPGRSPRRRPRGMSLRTCPLWVGGAPTTDEAVGRPRGTSLRMSRGEEDGCPFV